MKITSEEFDKLANLAGLYFTEEEKAEFMPEFDEIIEFADRIKAAAELTENDTEGLKPVESAEIKPEKAAGLEEKNVKETIVEVSELRPDILKDSLPQEKILADRGRDGYFELSGSTFKKAGKDWQ